MSDLDEHLQFANAIIMMDEFTAQCAVATFTVTEVTDYLITTDRAQGDIEDHEDMKAVRKRYEKTVTQDIVMLLKHQVLGEKEEGVYFLTGHNGADPPSQCIH